jgi:hypothetical protein
MPKNINAGRDAGQDLPDSEDDRKHLQPEHTTLDLPDVSDIPGQEHVRPPRINEMRDTTISSSDEEGEGLFVEDEEREDLKKSASVTAGDESEMDIEESSLDSEDDEGTPLEEKNLEDDEFGEDLDLPESEGVTDEE